jgi:hypothetical protein
MIGVPALRLAALLLEDLPCTFQLSLRVLACCCSHRIRTMNRSRAAFFCNEQFAPVRRFVSFMLQTVTIIPGRNGCSNASGA